MLTIIAIGIGYAIGSVSFAILLSKLLKKPDPRTTGSGNAGATNILRTVGKNQALAVLIGDALKGLVAVLIGKMFGASGMGLALVALAAVAGHVFPFLFDFKGGKGVATAIGAFLGLSLFLGVLVIAAWVATAYLTRYASLASLVAMAAAVVVSVIFINHLYFIPTLLIAGLVTWKHAENINRIKTKTEDKLNF